MCDRPYVRGAVHHHTCSRRLLTRDGHHRRRAQGRVSSAAAAAADTHARALAPTYTIDLVSRRPLISRRGYDEMKNEKEIHTQHIYVHAIYYHGPTHNTRV